jgi:hypothetical protein
MRQVFALEWSIFAVNKKHPLSIDQAHIIEALQTHGNKERFYLIGAESQRQPLLTGSANALSLVSLFSDPLI